MVVIRSKFNRRFLCLISSKYGIIGTLFVKIEIELQKQWDSFFYSQYFPGWQSTLQLAPGISGKMVGFKIECRVWEMGSFTALL